MGATKGLTITTTGMKVCSGCCSNFFETLHYPSEKRMFFVAALTEMSGNEKQLATDANCSLILERMTYSMDDFVRRVFVDRLAGS